MPPPPCDDTPGASHSAYNFIPTESAPSSSRKRTVNFDNETVVNAIVNINSYFEGKKSRIDHEREEFANCLAIVRAMEIPLRLKIKAGEHLGLASTRDFFLNSDEYTTSNTVTTKHVRLTGNDWVGEILTGPDSSFYRCARMTKPVFHALVDELLTRNLMHQSERARVSVVEKVMMFLRTVSRHLRQRISGERFQHSLDTVNRGVHEVINALVRLVPEYITPPNFNEIPPQVLNSEEFYPYFEV
ncbi:hypothetical protein ACS0TY_014440 [Phlomoides rotata]